MNEFHNNKIKQKQQDTKECKCMFPFTESSKSGKTELFGLERHK